jgi:hypothetical protein
MPDGTSEFDYALSPEETRDWDEGNTTDFVSLMTKIMVSFTRRQASLLLLDSFKNPDMMIPFPIAV